MIVVNDASTDETQALAERAGARVLDVTLRKISAVRNAGARHAKGTTLFFIDADTQVSGHVIQSALRALEEGAIAGGARVQFRGPIPRHVRLTLSVFNFLYGRILGWAAGCFIFAQRDAFERVGGFDETLYAGEEIMLSIALKKQGKFAVLRDSVATSARKSRQYSSWAIIPFAWRFLRYGKSMLRRREGLEWWYEGKREKK